MRQIKLSQQGKYKSLNLVALVDDSDYEYLNQWRWCAVKRGGNMYAVRGVYSVINGKRKVAEIKMHRLLLGLTDPKILADHEDRNGLNNQRENIRVATKGQNRANSRSNKKSTSKYIGVCWCDRLKKWMIQIQVNGKKKHLGLAITERDAAIIYNKWAIKFHGEFANLNKLAS